MAMTLDEFCDALGPYWSSERFLARVARDEALILAKLASSDLIRCHVDEPADGIVHSDGHSVTIKRRMTRAHLEADELGNGANEVVDPNDPDAGRVWTDNGGVDG